MAVQEPLKPPVLPDGMTAALNKQRMKFVSEKNEIAERAVQKLPDATSSDDLSGGSAPKTDIKANPDVSQSTKESFDSNLAMNLSAKGIATDLVQDKSTGKIESPLPAAAQAERVNHLVSQEAVTIRQSGANSLAVSLKVDPHTELFLQLTNHDGQIQASIRCERGNIEGLDSHWGQLQESLARQNVHLLPLEDKTAARGTASRHSAADRGIFARL